jgi:hypothetical protein
VKPEQASKAQMEATSRHPNGEVRREGSEQPTSEGPSASRGNGRSTHTSKDRQHGRPDAVPSRKAGQLGRCEARTRRSQESEEPIVPLKPGNAGGGKGLWFEARREETRREAMT